MSLSREKRRQKFLSTYADLGSIRDLFEPYAEREGVTPAEFAAQLARIASSDSKDARDVLRRWEALTGEDRARDHEFDFCVEEAKVSLFHFKQLLVTLAQQYSRMKAAAIISSRLPELVERGVAVARGKEKDDGSKTLHRLLEKEGLLDKPGPGVVVNATPTVVTPGSSPLPEAEDFSRMLDEALSRRNALPAPGPDPDDAEPVM